MEEDEANRPIGLLQLHEDALVAVLLRALEEPPTQLVRTLRHTAAALAASCSFFSRGLGAHALEAAALHAVSALLGVPHVAVAAATRSDSTFHAILFALRTHESAAPVACGGCHTLLRVPLRTPHRSATARRRPLQPVLLSCGSNEAGQLGNGSRAIFNAAVVLPTTSYDTAEYTARRSRQLEISDPSCPSLVDSLDGAHVAAVAAGHAHSLALTHDGHVYAWGDTRSGQCGAPATLVTVLTPRLIPFLARRVAQVAAGQLHSAFLLTSGEVYCCGENSSGQLGVDDHGPAGVMAFSTPQRVRLPGRVITIATGGFHTLAVCEGVSREVWGWGSGSAGQLGVNGVRRLATPPPPPQYGPATNAGPAAAGDGVGGSMLQFESAAVPTRVRGWCHGERPSDRALHDDHGEHGAASGGQLPAAWQGDEGGTLPPCAQLAAGLYHSLFLTIAGVAMRTGGELGPSHPSTVHAPEAIAAIAHLRVVRIAAGALHSAFITADGELWTCGAHKYGRLGLPANLPPAILMPQPSIAWPPLAAAAEVEAQCEQRGAQAGSRASPSSGLVTPSSLGTLPMRPLAQPSSSAKSVRGASSSSGSLAGGHEDQAAPDGAAATAVKLPVPSTPAAPSAPVAGMGSHVPAISLLITTDNIPRRVPLPGCVRARWVSAGAEHTVVLTTDQAAPPLCFGRNVFGQLGTADRRARGFPADEMKIPETVGELRDGLTAAMISAELDEGELSADSQGAQNRRGSTAGTLSDDQEAEKAAPPVPICRVLSRWG